VIKKENLDKINSIQNIELKRNKRDYSYNDILSDALNLLWKDKNYVIAVSDETLNGFEKSKRMYAK
jgi:hypothetical protein